MAIRNFAKCLSVAALAVACTVHDPEWQAPNFSEPVSSEPLVLSVRVDDGLLDRIEAGEPVLEELGAAHVRRIFPDAGIYEARSREAGLHRYYSLTFPEEFPLTRAVDALEEVPGILSVHPQHKVRLRATFDDPYFPKQWHFENSRYPKADIGVVPVWERYTKGRADVVVAVVDECVDPTHPDLQANLWDDGSGHIGYNFARESRDLSIRNGDSGHGTHVAGIIGAVNNNGTGVCGIAGGDAAAGVGGVRLMSCGIFSGEVIAGADAIAQAIKWSADHGAVISQNSWGYVSEDVGLEEYKSWKFDDRDPVRGAIDYFIRYAGCDENGAQRADSPMKGGLVFFAAGNEGIDWDYICSQHDDVIAVGAFGLDGNRAAYSNYGDWVDIAAPGAAASSRDDVIWSTVPFSLSSAGYEGIDSEGYVWLGTSMATPHASGVAALLVSYFGGPGFTAESCRELLLAGLGETVGGWKAVGRRLNALASFDYALSADGPRLILARETADVRAHEVVDISVSVASREEVSIRCEPGSPALRYDPAACRAVITGRDAAPGTYEAVFTATETLSGKTSSATLRYTLHPNHPPQLKAQPENLYYRKLQVNQTLALDDIFSDEDGETLACTATVSPEGVVDVLCSGDHVFVTAAGYGIAEVELRASDAFGESATARFRAAVVNPEAPVTLYPDLVSTDAYIMVDGSTPAEIRIAVYTSTGARVLESTQSASVFEPAHLDVSGLAPGRYTVDVSYAGATHRVRMIKY